MSKETIHSLIKTIDTQLNQLEDDSIEIEDAISIYSKTLTLASDLTQKLTDAEQKITILTEKGESLINDLHQL